MMKKYLLHVLAIYFLLQALPLDWKSWQYLFSVNWLHVQYQQLFNLAHYTTRFSAGEPGYATWGILLLISFAGALTIRHIDDEKLYYRVRVVLRYRLALALLAYGFVKFFPLLAPYPSISHLNTPYGHFNRWKLFSLTLGVVPGYELFLGLTEIIIALLLLYRRTASIGAFVFIIFCGNVFFSNLAYEGGDQVYSLLLITFALVVLAGDLERLFRLLILQQPAAPATFRPAPVRSRWVLKSVFILVFFFVYGIKAGSSHNAQYPATKGLPGAAGLYNVSQFSVHGTARPYSVNDSTRWQDVVFEEWNTLSIHSGNTTPVDSFNEHRLYTEDEQRRYETEGTNWRKYYSYTVDPVNKLLLLKNRNTPETLLLHYTVAADRQITLSGDSIYVVLDRLPKKYLLEEAAKGNGRNRKLKL